MGCIDPKKRKKPSFHVKLGAQAINNIRDFFKCRLQSSAKADSLDNGLMIILQQKLRNWVFATNSVFVKPIFLQPFDISNYECY